MSRYDPRSAGCACNVCPLSRFDPVPPEGPDDAVVCVVGDSPGPEDVRRRRPFIGTSGRLLEEMLEDAGVSRSSVWITNTLLCRPWTPGLKGVKQHDLQMMLKWINAENAKRYREAKAMRKAGLDPGELNLIPSPIDCCRARLFSELYRLEWNAQQAKMPNGAVIITLGNLATLTLTGKGGITKLRGSPVPIDVSEDGVFTPRWDPRPQEAVLELPPYGSGQSGSGGA